MLIKYLPLITDSKSILNSRFLRSKCQNSINTVTLNRKEPRNYVKWTTTNTEKQKLNWTGKKKKQQKRKQRQKSTHKNSYTFDSDKEKNNASKDINMQKAFKCWRIQTVADVWYNNESNQTKKNNKGKEKEK